MECSYTCGSTNSNKMFIRRKPSLTLAWRSARQQSAQARQKGPGKAFSPSHAAPITALTGTLRDAGM